MNKEIQEKADLILDYIEKDRQVANDPYFSTRLMARTEHYFSTGQKKQVFTLFRISLQPILGIAVVLLGLFIGIFSASRLSTINHPGPVAERTVRLEQLANESFITDINRSAEEQFLSK